MNTRLLYLILFAFVGNYAVATVYKPQDVPNPKTHCAVCWVANPDGILSDAAVATLNAKINRLEAENGTEIAIAAVGSIGYYDEYTFAYELFNSWHVGKSDNNSGVLILFVNDIRAVKIETGVGVEGLLPDAFCNRLLDETMFPYFKRGDYDGGMIAGVDAIAQRLTSDDAMAELLLNANSPRVRRGNALAAYLTVGLLLLIVFAWASYGKMQRLYGENNEKYRQLGRIVGLAVFFAVLFPLPMAFMAGWLRRRRRAIRRMPMSCPHCGTTMRLLSEQEEDRFLASSQIAEEDVASVDYDVWHCDNCQQTRILPYLAVATPYKTCPQCGARTYKLDRDVVLLAATTAHAGKGQKVFKCNHCHFEKAESYIIPRRQKNVVVVGGIGGSSGSFGGGGGSFGGGFSGGGGAGGRF